MKNIYLLCLLTSFTLLLSCGEKDSNEPKNSEPEFPELEKTALKKTKEVGVCQSQETQLVEALDGDTYYQISSHTTKSEAQIEHFENGVQRAQVSVSLESSECISYTEGCNGYTPYLEKSQAQFQRLYRETQLSEKALRIFRKVSGVQTLLSSDFEGRKPKINQPVEYSVIQDETFEKEDGWLYLTKSKLNENTQSFDRNLALKITETDTSRTEYEVLQKPYKRSFEGTNFTYLKLKSNCEYEISNLKNKTN